MRSAPFRGILGLRPWALFVAALFASLSLASCERPAPQPAPPAAASQPSPGIPLSPAMQARAALPAGPPTGLFLDRQKPTDLRIMSYNVNFDSVFPDKNTARAERFQRIVKAVDADVLALQELREKSAADVQNLMDAINPLPAGGRWHTYKGWTNVIISKYPLRLTSDHPVPKGQRELAMALIDLPDDRFRVDLYLLNNHFKCCGGTTNDPARQQQADALVSWLRDARTPGGEINLPPHTPIVIAGDLNLVGGLEPLSTLLTGDIKDEAAYGVDGPPDWDNSDLTDAHPMHNGGGPDDYTWRDDGSNYKPSRLDFILYTDAVLSAVHAFVLNTTLLSEEELARCHLERLDVALDDSGARLDHLPVVADFRLASP